MSAPTAAASVDGTSPVIGRSEIADWLRSLVERVREGRGGAYLLLGDSGVGKSTLVASAVRHARGAGMLVLEGRALPRELAQPFEPLKEALRNLAPGSPSMKGDAGALRGIWVPDRSGPSTLLPLGLMPWNERRPASLTEEGPDSTADRVWDAIDRGGIDVEEDRLVLFDRLHQALLSASHEQPVLLVLEDLQNADRATLEFFRYLARHLVGTSLGLLGSAVPWGSDTSELKEVMEDLGREGLLETQHVRALNVNEVADYLRWLSSGKEPDPETVTRLFAASEGNPLFLERLARGERGHPVSVGHRASSADEETRRVEEGFSILLEAPNDLARRLLVYGAVLGKEFSFAAVARVAEEDEEAVARSLERLVRQGVLVEKASEVYAFQLDASREEVLASLTETRRRRVHRKLGEVLEVLGPGSEGEEAWIRELALHFHQGRHDLRSYEYNCRLYELARHQGHVNEGVEAIDHALEAVRRISPPGPHGHREHEREVLLQMGEILAERGELLRSEEKLMQAFQMFLPNEPHEAVQIALARTHLYQGKFAEAHRRVESLLPRADDPSPSPAAVEAAGLVAEATLALGRGEEAFARASVALQMAERLPDLILLGDSCRRLADWYVRRTEETPRAAALYNRALRLYEEGSDRLRRERIAISLAEVDFLRGRSEEGFRRLDRVETWAREGGARLVEVEALLRESHHALDTGQLDRAHRAVERAQVLLPPAEGPRFEFHYGLLGGRHAHRKGDSARGWASLDKAEAVARRSGVPSALCEVLLVRAEAEVARGDTAAAKRYLKEARATGALRPSLQHRYRELVRSLEDPAAPPS